MYPDTSAVGLLVQSIFTAKGYLLVEALVLCISGRTPPSMLNDLAEVVYQVKSRFPQQTRSYLIGNLSNVLSNYHIN